MRKIGFAISAAALLSAGALVSNPAEATTFATSAGMRLATEGVQPVEQVTYRYYGRGYYPRFRAYAHYPHHRYSYYRRYHHGYY